ncbi:GbsR/MarR family transcriptional regulator [Actinacidiphila alni]|uniref:GbsR/MarR family transcriptional regulator n=1 Tax=Actinacidiphila alni TaxID=380248 RepID=UPI0034531077
MAEPREDDDLVEVRGFIERFAAEMVEAGMQRMAARVFAALLVSEDGALSSAELSDTLRVSPAAVSGAVRYLAQVGMVHRERDPGSRRELYRVHNDQWYETFTSRSGVLARWEGTLRSGMDAVGEGTEAGRRLAETAAFFAFLQKELGAMMDRWREYRATL